MARERSTRREEASRAGGRSGEESAKSTSDASSSTTSNPSASSQAAGDSKPSSNAVAKEAGLTADPQVVLERVTSERIASVPIGSDQAASPSIDKVLLSAGDGRGVANAGSRRGGVAQENRLAASQQDSHHLDLMVARKVEIPHRGMGNVDARPAQIHSHVNSRMNPGGDVHSAPGSSTSTSSTSGSPPGAHVFPGFVSASGKDPMKAAAASSVDAGFADSASSIARTNEPMIVRSTLNLNNPVSANPVYRDLERMEFAAGNHSAIGAVRADEATVAEQRAAHLAPRIGAQDNADSRTTLASRDDAARTTSGNTMAGMVDIAAPVAAFRAENAIAVAGEHMNIGTRLWRGSEEASRAMDGGTALARVMRPTTVMSTALQPERLSMAGEPFAIAMRREGTRAIQSGVSALEHTAPSTMLARLKSMDGTNRESSNDEPMHRSAVRVREAARETFRDSPLTHREAPNGLSHRAAEFPAGSFSSLMSGAPNISKSISPNIYRAMTHSDPVVARAATTTVSTAAPSLPTVSSQSTATIHGMKKVELAQLANRVYDLLVRRLASEKQRRGQ